jgi:arsenite methyltransferase
MWDVSSRILRHTETLGSILGVMKASYGIDAPTVVRNLALSGAVCTAVALWSRFFDGPTFLRFFLWPGVAWLATALWMITGSKVMKLRVRDRVLDRIALQSGEHVLDVGCGRGLLLIGAAKRGARAVGLDLWRTVDQSGNDAEVTKKNAQIENVDVTLDTGDMTKMPCPDESFDAVISSWAIHNVPTAEGRAQALKEIARVLKKGGRVEIVDIGPGRSYGDTLKAAGLVDVKTVMNDFIFFIPTWRTSATRAR